MTEPVAYIQIKDGKAYSVLRKGTPNDEYTPVYTAEQLHPMVKMTQAEFDEFNSMPVFASVYGAMLALYSGNVIRYSVLLKRFSGNDGQIEFANLWFYYHIKHKAQGELIDIVPETKWFVRSKEKDIDGDFWYLKKTEQFFFREYVKENSTQFETKEEAEKWTNPLTEAVQLPVEDE
ncbi:hypothetical protein JK162_01630 [Leuconostoc pseudomesenteroides]|uniref:hypothetical protein n=1 Tax=Leuconostoc pseudomesenteroides TaxID=33968 RepID=UPI001B8BB2C9|nr:hypothetical protein [Leuconostoc pseudomesenteroides]MBS0957201.1 hypothetical protein [Leuconostoc pseudomesenteroides]